MNNIKTIIEMLVEAGFAKSNGEARRLIRGRGIKLRKLIDGQDIVIESEDAVTLNFTGALYVGKKRKAVFVDGDFIGLNMSDTADSADKRIKTTDVPSVSAFSKLQRDHKAAIKRIEQLEDAIHENGMVIPGKKYLVKPGCEEHKSLVERVEELEKTVKWLAEGHSEIRASDAWSAQGMVPMKTLTHDSQIDHLRK